MFSRDKVKGYVSIQNVDRYEAFTDAGRTKTVADFIREAKAAGVHLLACSMALAEHRRGKPLITECDGLAGAATVVAAAVEPGTRTLVF